MIGSRNDYDLAFELLERLMDADPPQGSPEGGRLEALAMMIEHYEEKHFPILPLSPVELSDLAARYITKASYMMHVYDGFAASDLP